MSLHCPRWVQVAMCVIGPSLTLAVCSNGGLLHPTRVNWKLGLLLLLGLVPQIQRTQLCM